jgi:hypothetical protein
MIVLKKALPRRTFLRGLGATVALPMLDAMVPAFTPVAHAAASVTRLGYFYVPNGIIQDERWAPAASGPLGGQLPVILEAMQPVRKHMIVTTGLDNKQVEPLGDGNGNHPRATGGWLNGAHPKKAEGSDVRAGITADQVAALAWVNETPLPSLEMGLDGNQVIGACDNGYSCIYLNTLSWRSATQPLPVENNPGVIFERMFGEGGDPARRRAQLSTQRSLLDSVMAEFAGLKRTLGASDRTTIDGYLDSVREVEQRIQRAQEQSATDFDLPTRPFGVPPTFAEHIRLMYDLLLLAYRADITRVITFQVAREISGNTYPEIGVTQGHHGVTHHAHDPEKVAICAKINAYHLMYFSELLQKMQATPDGDGTLLDHSLMLYGSGLGDGDAHSPLNLNALLVGGAAAGVKGDRHLRFQGEPFTNLLLTMLDKAGVRPAALGDSTGRFKLDTPLNSATTIGAV